MTFSDPIFPYTHRIGIRDDEVYSVVSILKLYEDNMLQLESGHSVDPLYGQSLGPQYNGLYSRCAELISWGY